jgi:hypothetical protein
MKNAESLYFRCGVLIEPFWTFVLSINKDNEIRIELISHPMFVLDSDTLTPSRHKVYHLVTVADTADHNGPTRPEN